MRLPASFPIAARISALIGSICRPLPIAMKELRNGWPSIVPRTFTKPRVPKNATESGHTTYVQLPLLAPFCRTALNRLSNFDISYFRYDRSQPTAPSSTIAALPPKHNSTTWPESCRTTETLCPGRLDVEGSFRTGAARSTKALTIAETRWRGPRPSAKLSWVESAPVEGKAYDSDRQVSAAIGRLPLHGSGKRGALITTAAMSNWSIDQELTN